MWAPRHVARTRGSGSSIGDWLGQRPNLIRSPRPDGPRLRAQRPVPRSWMVCGLTGALEVSLRAATLAPVLRGLKATVTWQVPPGAIGPAEHVFPVRRKEGAFGPVIATDEKVTG